MSEEKHLTATSGYGMLAAVISALLAIVGLFIWSLAGIAGTPDGVDAPAVYGWSLGFSIVAFCIWFLPLNGFFSLQPGQARVCILFGKYVGTVRDEGFFWANPFFSRSMGVSGASEDAMAAAAAKASLSLRESIKAASNAAKGLSTTISTRVRTLNGERLKVNDKMGNPIEIATVVGWHVADPAKEDAMAAAAAKASLSLRESIKAASNAAKGLSTTISTRVRTLNGERLKVNDKMGNPIEIATVVGWHVADPAKALFDVDDYQSYVAMQTETALRHVASVYAYDHLEDESDAAGAITLRANVEEVSEAYVAMQTETALRHVASVYAYDHLEDESDAAGAITLRANVEEVSEALRRELAMRLAPAGVEVDDARLTHLAYSPEIAQAMLRRQQAEAVIAARKKIVEGMRLAPAGVEVDDARLTHLAYSPEIAQAMLRRQQAEAVIAARKKIVEGAVSMVDMAVKEMAAGGTIELDDERKAQMASNLMVVLCGESEAHPVLNAGSLY